VVTTIHCNPDSNLWRCGSKMITIFSWMLPILRIMF
jgi:hypothetical protein